MTENKVKTTITSLTSTEKSISFHITLPLEDQLLCLRFSSKPLFKIHPSTKKVKNEESSEIKIFGKNTLNWFPIFEGNAELNKFDYFIFPSKHVL